MQLEIEEQALMKEKDEASKKRLEALREELKELKEEQAELQKKWQFEKEGLEQLQKKREILMNTAASWKSWKASTI